MEENWDWVAVEVRDVTDDPDSDAWTTLPEADTDGDGDADTSLTTQSTGDSCPEGLAEQVHPQLAHYWTVNPADEEDGCDPTGTTGEWNAFTGSSGGWTDWTVDLSAYAGRTVELRIATITDWGTLGLGAWVDDWRLSDGATEIEFEDFEAPLDASWLIGPPPEGTPAPERLDAARPGVHRGRRGDHGRHRVHRVRLRGHQRERPHRVHGAHARAPRRDRRDARGSRRGRRRLGGATRPPGRSAPPARSRRAARTRSSRAPA